MKFFSKIKTKIKSFVDKFKTSIRFRKKVIFFTIFMSGFLWLFWGIPLPTKLSSNNLAVSTKILDRNGKLIFEFFCRSKKNTHQT